MGKLYWLARNRGEVFAALRTKGGLRSVLETLRMVGDEQFVASLVDDVTVTRSELWS